MKNSIEKVLEKNEKNEIKEVRIKNFADILDNIDSLEDKKKMLWKEIYENALEDREKAKMLFNDAYISMTGGVNEHMNIGAIMSKYLERMTRSNDQILKLAELIAKEEEKSEAISEDDIFGKINGWVMFKTGIVLFYVKEHSREEIQRIIKVVRKYKSNLDIPVSEENIELVANNLPIGTIICQDTNSDDNNISICLPMFSSHVSMPVKTNECVWFFTHVDRKANTRNIQNNLPLLDLRNYWLSRKIGTKISEETNFWFYQRDALINKNSTDRINSIDKKIKAEANNNFKKNLEKDKESEEKIIRLPNFDSSISYGELYPSAQAKSKINKSNTFKIKEANDKFFLRPVPRWYSKSHELSLQGSNNTLINLSISYLNNSETCKDKGIIDLVSGRHFIRKYIPNNDSNTITLENKNVDNFSSKLTVELPIDSFVVLKNTTTKKTENIKNTDYYLNNSFNNKDFYDFEKKEGVVNFQNDASRIYISEL